MKANLTDEQAQLQESTAEFLESNGGIELARRRMEGESDVVDELWDDLAEMDYPAVTVPLEQGGLGEGMVYLSALLEAAGRYAMPGPFPETTAFAVPLIAELGDEDQKDRHLRAVADGDRRFSFALYDDRNESLPGAVQLDGEVGDDGSLALSGTKTLVPYGGEVDRIVVAARTRNGTGYDGLTACVVNPESEGVEATQLRSLDRTRPVYEVELDTTVEAEDVLGPVHGAGSALSAAVDRFAVAACAMLVGGADRATEFTAEYATEREQYGQPIGRFQAVKHRIADMWMDMQNARSLTYYAAWAIDADEADAPRAVSGAKSFTTERLHRAFGDGMKSHGGTGFTWDNDSHIYLKQAKAWRNFLGSPEEHREAVAASLLD